MASATVPVPLEEYLETCYRPDCDWIDGELKERNAGERAHASIQAFLVTVFQNNELLWRVEVLPELRVQTSAAHYRVADVCVVRDEDPDEPIVRSAPLLCVEILSRNDRMSEVHERVRDYLAMGVRAVWIIDPRLRQAFESTAQGGPRPSVGKPCSCGHRHSRVHAGDVCPSGQARLTGVSASIAASKCSLATTVCPTFRSESRTICRWAWGPSGSSIQGAREPARKAGRVLRRRSQTFLPSQVLLSACP